MKGCPDRALDTHIYQAWMDVSDQLNYLFCTFLSDNPFILNTSISRSIWQPSSRLTFYNNACAQKQQIALMEREFGPVIVGEWR